MIFYNEKRNSRRLSIKFLCVTLPYMSIQPAQVGCQIVIRFHTSKQEEPRVPVQPGILFHGQQIVPKGKVSFGLHSFLLRFVYL